MISKSTQRYLFIVFCCLLFGSIGNSQVAINENFDLAFPSGWTVISGGTGCTWARTTANNCAGSGSISVCGSSQSDDTWLLSPSVAMIAGDTFLVSFLQKTDGLSCGGCDKASLELRVGRGATKAAQLAGSQIADYCCLDNLGCQLRTAVFVCPESGSYNFSWHCYSGPIQSTALRVDEISVERVGGSLLFINLGNFIGKRVGNNEIKLDWSTRSENSSSHFVVERSHDGVLFSVMGVVQASTNSASTINYEFLDRDPMSGINYYRLHYFGLDGSSSYSRIIAVEISKEGNLNLRPNPSSDQVQVNLGALPNGGEVNVIDMTGRTIYTTSFSDSQSNLLSIDVSRWPSGIYLFELKSGTTVYRKMFIKSTK